MINQVEKTVEIDGKEVTIVVRRPNNEVSRKAERFRIQMWNDNLSAGILTKRQLLKKMVELGEWSAVEEAKEQTLQDKLGDLEKTLYTGDGKTKPKVSDGRELALEIRRTRMELRELISRKLQLEQNSAEALSEDAKFDFLVSNCTFFKSTGKKVYNTFSDYESRSVDSVAFVAAQALGEIMYNIEPDFEAKLPENVFLSKFGLINEDLSLIDPNEGYTVDVDGNRIDSEGYYVDEEGNRVDLEGNEVNSEGLYELTEYENDLVKAKPKKRTKTTTKKTSDSE